MRGYLISSAFCLLLVLPAFAQTGAADTKGPEVFVGRIPCELGVVIELLADSKAAGQFILKMNKLTYQLAAVETTTGVIRLEDKKEGAVWLQLPNKSMLMNQKLGRRLADECMSPAQVAAGQAMKINPVPGLLDALPQASPSAIRPAASAPVPSVMQPAASAPLPSVMQPAASAPVPAVMQPAASAPLPIVMQPAASAPLPSEMRPAASAPATSVIRPAASAPATR